MEFFDATVKLDEIAAMIVKVLGSVVMVSLVLSACGTVSPTPVKQKNDPVVELSGKVQTLQRQLRERDKRIAELESQLEALKLIDQDSERQKKPLQSPATPIPIQ